MGASLRKTFAPTPCSLSRVSESRSSRSFSSPLSWLPLPSRSNLRTDSVPSPSLWRSRASRIRSKESSGMEILPDRRRWGMEYSLKYR